MGDKIMGWRVTLFMMKPTGAWRARGLGAKLAVVAPALGLLACSSSPGSTDAATDAVVRELVIERVVDLGQLPQPSTTVVGRDGGPAGLLGGRILWTFGDTFLQARNPIDNSNVLSATGGWSSVAAPLVLTQPVDSGGFPAQLIPYTAAELAQNQTAPLDGWALWPGTMIDTGEAEGLLIFQRIKRSNGTGYDSMGVGTARIAVDATVATRVVGDLFAPPEPLFIPQSVANGMVYALACNSGGFLNIGCKMGRAPVAAAGTRAAYLFFDGSDWQADITRAKVTIDGLGGTPTLSWNPHLGRFLAITGRILSSTMQLRTADFIEGPWSAPVEIAASADGSTGIFAPTSADASNYVIIEHPELRSAYGRELVISYSRPTEPFRGDVRLARITLR